MKVKTLKLVALAFLITCAVPIFLFSGDTSSQETLLSNTGLATAENLEANYQTWAAEYEKDGGDQNMTLAIGWFKGLSTGSSYAKGLAKINLIDGKVSVEIGGLAKDEGWDVWLVDSVAGRSIMPEPDDAMLNIGSLKHEGTVAKLEVNLGSDAFDSFDMDLIIVTKSGKNPTEDRTLAGTTSLFHRLYRSAQRGQFGLLADHDPVPPATEERGIFKRLIDALSPTVEAQMGPNPFPTSAQQALIAEGRRSFFNDTFEGNGRTCGTCHREDANFTIDPEFIATLPIQDPLFVAETQPALAHNFENPTLMRKLGLILENPDGFGNLETNFVMRGVPHTLALLPNTLTPVANGGDGTTTPPNERTGWGGDGAPGTGTLREFIIGAITQHYPRTLNRTPGADFILPTVAQLDALEAFQKSLGRREDLILTGPGALSLKNAVAREGQRIFTNGGPAFGGTENGQGKCFFCHLNAGASDFFFPGQNANFNTNVEGLPSQPADLIVPPAQNPQDGGFGTTGISPTGGIGNGSFNTPVLVEAADTGPFFHNNAIETIEGAVDFYNSRAFNEAPGFGGVAGVQIRLEATEVVAVAAFLRVINALENVRSALDLANRAKSMPDNAAGNEAQKELARLASTEAIDALEVLTCAGLHPETQFRLLDAASLLDQASRAIGRADRINKINSAIKHLTGARSDMKN